MLVITAMIWGAAFVAQSVGMDYMSPITFNCIRCIIGGVVLLPVVAIFSRKKRKNAAAAITEPKLFPAGADPTVGAEVSAFVEPHKRKRFGQVKKAETVIPPMFMYSSEAQTAAAHIETSAEIYAEIRSQNSAVNIADAVQKRARRDLWLGGILCGAVLFVASTLQQVGLVYTSAGKAGFITALYIVIVPAMGLFFGRRAPFTVWAGAVIAVIGLYMLSVKENFSVSPGDLLILICAFCFSVHIMLISYFSPRCDGVAMSCIQFFVAGILGIIPMFIFEQPTVTAIFSGWLPILYAGVMSCGVAYTLQIIAQRDVKETVASLLMSLESVFAAITGWLVLHEKLSPSEFVGCILIFGAVILAQLPPTKMKLPWMKK
jgi:Permeases of the drug/metabolite transporter (DMT) superfamily